MMAGCGLMMLSQKLSALNVVTTQYFIYIFGYPMICFIIYFLRLSSEIFQKWAVRYQREVFTAVTIVILL